MNIIVQRKILPFMLLSFQIISFHINSDNNGSEPNHSSIAMVFGVMSVVSLPPSQIGWGLYPVMLKEFATEMNPLIFSFYRDFGAFPLLLFCGIIVERKVMIPRLKMILVGINNSFWVGHSC